MNVPNINHRKTERSHTVNQRNQKEANNTNKNNMNNKNYVSERKKPHRLQSNYLKQLTKLTVGEKEGWCQKN